MSKYHFPSENHPTLYTLYTYKYSTLLDLFNILHYVYCSLLISELFQTRASTISLQSAEGKYKHTFLNFQSSHDTTKVRLHSAPSSPKLE